MNDFGAAVARMQSRLAEARAEKAAGKKSWEKAVVNGVVKYTSISAINRFLGCERSWWFRYVAGMPDDAGPAAQFGTGAHARFEYAYEKRSIAELGPVERAGLHLMVDPLADIPGHGFEYPVHKDFNLGGIRVSGGMDSLHLDPGEGLALMIRDLKFKGAKSYGQAGDDEWRQLVAYAEAARQEFGLSGLADLRHVHFLREGRPKADAWYARVPLDSVKTEWQSLADSVAPRLRETARATQAKDVPANTGQCLKYGKPCVYSKVCPLSAGQRIRAMQRVEKPKGENMGLLSSKVMSLATGAPAPSSPPPAAPVAPAAAPPAVLDIGATYRLTDGRTGKLEILEGGIATFSIDGARQDVAVTKIVALAEPIQSAPAVATPAPSVPAVTAEQAQAAVAEEAAKEPVKAGPGRPKKVKAPAPAPTETAAPAPVQASLVLPTEPPTTQSIPAPAAEQLRLYFGCTPTGVQVQTLHSYVAGLEKKILEAAKDESGDVRLSRNAMLEFGKWKATIGLAAIEVPPAPGHYIVGDGEKERAVAEALATVCAPGCVVSR